MAVEINEYRGELAERFEKEARRIRDFLPEGVAIEHVGSTAVGIGGKNIIDILVGVNDEAEMKDVQEVLTMQGYFAGRDKRAGRIFMASSEEETGEGDFHIHICLKKSDTYKDMVVLRDYLIKNPKVAQEYLRKKKIFAKRVGYEREKYKKLKSAYMNQLLNNIR